MKLKVVYRSETRSPAEIARADARIAEILQKFIGEQHKLVKKPAKPAPQKASR